MTPDQKRDIHKWRFFEEKASLQRSMSSRFVGCDLNFGKHGKVNVDPKLIHKNIYIYIDIQIHIYIYIQIVKFIRGAAAVIMCQHDHQNVCFHAGLRVSDMRWCCVRQKNASTKAVGRNNRDSDEFFLERPKKEVV